MKEIHHITKVKMKNQMIILIDENVMFCFSLHTFEFTFLYLKKKEQKMKASSMI